VPLSDGRIHRPNAFDVHEVVSGVVLAKPSRCRPKSLGQLADRVKYGSVGPVVAI
jgi:hypothetical protein